MSLDVCNCTIIHVEKVEKIKENLKDKDFSDIQILSKCLADSSRIKMLYALMTFKEMCVCDLAAVLGASDAAASHHLRYLKQNGMLQSRRDGKVVYYSLLDEKVSAVIRSLSELAENATLES
ncbi:ArsR/SmtB family transcription factor [Alkalibacterium sp. f15]|uniref:ArsR/SmtB family transcription factor n=1 Tax=Alkalibacterium sp. f15 TaxID=3414029 RepID=UPI003BF8B50C